MQNHISGLVFGEEHLWNLCVIVHNYQTVKFTCQIVYEAETMIIPTCPFLGKTISYAFIN